MKTATEKLYPEACEDLIRCYSSGAFGIDMNLSVTLIEFSKIYKIMI